MTILKVSQVAKLLGVNRKTVYGWMSRGEYLVGLMTKQRQQWDAGYLARQIARHR